MSDRPDTEVNGVMIPARHSYADLVWGCVHRTHCDDADDVNPARHAHPAELTCSGFRRKLCERQVWGLAWVAVYSA